MVFVFSKASQNVVQLTTLWKAIISLLPMLASKGYIYSPACLCEQEVPLYSWIW